MSRKLLARPCDRRHFLKLLGASGLAVLLESCRVTQPTAIPATPSPLPPSQPPVTSTLAGTATPSATALPTATATSFSTATATPVPWPVVAIDPVTSYEPRAVRAALEQMLAEIGGLGDIVKTGARVGLKVNLTGGTWWDTPKKPPATELFVTHPAVVGALGELLRDAGASRLLVLDGLGDEANFSKWGYVDMAKSLNAELIDLCKPDPYPDFVRYAVQPHPFVYDSFHLNGILNELDVLISVAKLKVHSVAGVTLALKNMFGIAPISRYRRQLQDNNRSAFHDGSAYEQRVPRVILDLCQARPIHLALIDGIRSGEGGAGPWDPGLTQVSPGVLLAGKDPVATDAVAAAVMGFDPQAADRLPPFNKCENYLALAHEIGLGTHNLAEIKVAGAAIDQVRFPFKPATG